MSIIETVSDIDNSFLSRRELTCNFAGLGGKLKKLEAIDMISKEFKLDGKVIVPIKLENHVGKSQVTGTFYVYEDEGLAKRHIGPVVFNRLEKSKKASEPKEEEQSEAAEAKAEEKPEEAVEAKAEEKPEESKEEKSE